MPFGFSPYNMGVASISSCVVLLWCLDKRKPHIACLMGLLYGLGMFGLGVNWVYVSIHDYGYASPILAGFITLVFIFILSLFPAAMAFILNRYFFKNNFIRCLLAFPALWVVFELIRGFIFTGFPWLFVGYSQIENHLRDYATVGGVYTVSWATVLVAAILYGIIDYYYSHKTKTKIRNGLVALMLVVWGVAFGLHQIKWVTPIQQSLTVALVQGNVPQLMRWDPAAVTQIVNTYEELTQQALDINLIIWPEAAIPVPLPVSAGLFKQMDASMDAHNTGLIAGVPSEADKTHYYNSLIGVGRASGIYHKSHLVPFGEYVPLERFLRGIIAFFNLPMSSIIPGPTDQEPLTAQSYRFAPAICYEIAYPLFVQQMSQHADFILTVSNDAWFGTSIGPWQHLQIAQFRAIENGKYVLRATNTGLTAIIAPDGTIQAIAPQFEPYVLTGTVNAMKGQTLWSRFGVWPVLAGLIIVLGAAFWLRKEK
ncbi:MAG: apolipoprotein N-acyltransferase [Candidatus Berkiellales bacterium]